MTEPNAWDHYTPETAAQLLSAYRAEVLAETAAAIVAENDRVFWATRPGHHWAAELLLRMAKDLTSGESTPQPAAIENYSGELAMLRGLLGVIRVVAEHGDMDEVRRLLAEHASDEQAARDEGGAHRA
ncbi:hypothetical protein ABZS95_10395 [Streptomyces sp. NPDC005479]|uniref:hypothetical protein n=1 Tax=Streptomyces sp. NPDC005479 TaxID=3154879 RepID=UPI0033AC9A70